MEAQEYLRLTGTVEHIVYQKEESGFTVLELASADELITVVGEMPGVAEGEELVLTGNYVAHPTFGSQFRVSVYERQLPATAGAIYKYLAAGAIKGIGPALARRIVDRFGENTLDVMEKDPGQLCQVKGVSQRKAGEIAQEFKRIFRCPGGDAVFGKISNPFLHLRAGVEKMGSRGGGCDSGESLCAVPGGHRFGFWPGRRNRPLDGHRTGRSASHCGGAPVCAQPQPGQWPYLSACGNAHPGGGNAAGNGPGSAGTGAGGIGEGKRADRLRLRRAGFCISAGAVCGGNLYRRANGPDPFLLPGFGPGL